MNQTGIRKKKLSELEQALEPFSEFWEEWIISRGCFLRRREIDVILLYRKHGRFSIIASILGISVCHTSEIFRRTIHRLRWNYKLYTQWIGDRILEQAGVYDDMSEKDKFLITPLHYHEMPSGLYYSLSSHGETMSDVLNKFSEADLLLLRNFGKKKLDHLRKFLKQNDCHRLLKKIR